MCNQYYFLYIVLASEEKVSKLGLQPLARIVGYADAEI
jgi:acetyl-CoA acetyltransferase